MALVFYSESDKKLVFNINYINIKNRNVGTEKPLRLFSFKFSIDWRLNPLFIIYCC